MGQSQSSSQSTTNETIEDRKKCYYEVLNVDSQASDDELKKAYRKKALDLHPDRNLGNVEHTTKLFSEVQAAYEILSDPQERAWYDSHREAILSNNSAGIDEVHYERNVRVTTAEDITSLYVNFNGRFEFSDAPSGFFTVLRNFFDRLADEEVLSCNWQGLAAPSYPGFGTSQDTYLDTVKAFYASWSSFATEKTFSWKESYRYSEAPDRRTRRYMEKENKRLRDEGIKDFNNAVRALVTFVRKRDPRYTPNKQSEEERQKALRDMASAQAARSRAANMAKMAETPMPEWSQAHRDDTVAEFEDICEDEEAQEQVECIVCKKTFKSEKQYEAHEKSKKHIKAAQQLLRKMHKENKEFGLNSVPIEEGYEPNISALHNSDVQASELHNGDQNEGHQLVSSTEEVAKVEEVSDLSDDENDEYASRAEIERRIADMNIESELDDNSVEEPSVQNHPSNTTEHHTASRIGKAKAKRAKKAAAQNKVPCATPATTCDVCKESFPSRSSLFRHIDEHDHAVAKSSKTRVERRR